MNCEIIKANPKDIRALIKIQKKAFEPLYQVYKDDNSPYFNTIAQLKKHTKRSDTLFYKILAEGRLVGGLFWQNRGNGYWYLNRVFIDPEYQGRRIAQTAILKSEKYLLDAKLLGVDFPVDRTANKKCYEKCGFTTDTGKRIQINEKLTLAVYEKQIL